MQFLDFFAGVGGFRKGLELSGHQCVGFCEFDKYAVASYTSMHLITDEQRQYLNTLTFRQRQKEILKDEYRNGEWYANDIRTVSAAELPKSDCWCFGAPCQDFSVAGKRAGLDGDRSSLVREIFRLLEEQKEEDRPEWLIYENVKGMLSSNRGLDYLSILSEMDRLGYDVEWQNINSKWWVPQNRERIYTIGHLRRRGRRKVLPIQGTNGENSLKLIGCKCGRNSQRDRIYGEESLCPTISTCPGGDTEPKVEIKVIGTTNPNRHSSADIHSTEGIMSTCASRDYKQPKQIAIPVLTPDRIEKRQNGRRFKENEDPMFTLTSQDRHGVALDAIGIVGGLQEHQTIRNDGIAPTLTSAMGMGGGQTPCVFLETNIKPDLNIVLNTNSNFTSDFENGLFVKLSDSLVVYAIWYEKYHCYIVIRKLTPKECFRLQGWSDDYFEKAAFVNSETQLYKQAGNGVTVNVIEAIGEKLK